VITSSPLLQHPDDPTTAMGFYATIRDGERAALWSRSGSVRVVDGPKRVFVLTKRFEQLSKHFADHTEYLEVTRKDGQVDIMQGPVALFNDPVLHERIRVKKASLIDASEALVVYKGGGVTEEPTKAAGPQPSGTVHRRVVRGPARFIPAADEWVHRFEWSGQPKDGSKTSYQPKQLVFNNLRVVPSSAYHNVSEVRTNDDTLITVKLMLFFELNNIEKMLDATNDPIGDFINAASADVIAFCATLSYETFLNETYKLNQLGTFAQLCSRAEHIGYVISKVVFRGFQAGPKLQAMHDDAIQERTRLRLLEETEEQKQRAADIQLHAEQRRAKQQAELESSQASMKAELSMVSRKARLAEEQLSDEAAAEKARRRHEAEVTQLQATREAELKAERARFELETARNAEQLQMMRSMKELGVDLTKVLVSQHEQPDRVIKLDTGGGGGSTAAPKPGLLGALQLNL